MSIPTTGSAFVYEAKAIEALDHLGLKVARDRLDQACQQASAKDWSYSHFLGYLLDGELIERKRRCVELNLQFARFPYLKKLEDFDFAVQPSIDRRLCWRFCCSPVRTRCSGMPAKPSHTPVTSWWRLSFSRFTFLRKRGAWNLV